jgi:prepilin signal peptidase PulO-like enzyme (type II secretory pathway)
MKQLKLRAILLACWLIGFYLFAQYVEPVNLYHTIYLFILSLILVVFITPSFDRKKIWMVLTVPSIVFITIKALIGQPFTGSAILFSIIEITAILLTTLILLWIRRAIVEFENAVAQIMISPKSKVIESTTEGQSILYREVRRARNHQRPLALLAIAVDESTINDAMDRMVKEAQHSFMRQFTISNVSKTLCEKLEDCDIVVKTNNHFLVVLPETKPSDLPGLIDRLHRQVAEEIGVDLKFGSATLPLDSYTLEGLMDKATIEMEESLNPKLLIKPEKFIVKEKIS